MSTLYANFVLHWRLFWADRRAAALTFAVPIVLASAFGAVFDKPNDRETKLPVLVVCDGDAPAVVAFAESLLANPRLEAVRVTRGEAERRTPDRQPGVAIIIHDTLKFSLLHHPHCTSERQWAAGIVTEAALKHQAGPLLHRLPSVAITDVPVAGAANFNAYSHSFSGMTLQYLLFWGMESGLLLLRDRQRGVWRRVRTTPAHLAALLLGKALATAVIALLIVIVTFTFGHLVFGVRIAGSLAGFALLGIALGVLAAATGLVIGAVGGTEARARSLSILVILGVSMLGGLWMPAFLLPSWMRDAALLLPTTWAMQSLDAVTWQGHGLAAVLPSVGVVLAFTLVFIAFAYRRLAVQESHRRLGWGI